MRNELEAIIKDTFRMLALKSRAAHDLTQEQMAEALSMVPRSYTDIESGVHMCGTLTAILLLIDHPDPQSVLTELKERFAEIYDTERRSAS